MTCSCTASKFYWSSSDASNPPGAWFVDFTFDFVGTIYPSDNDAVRGVRGGS